MSAHEGFWRKLAACKGRGHLFTAGEDTPAEQVQANRSRAKAICGDCPVLSSCRTWAFSQDDDPCPFSVLAGMTPSERRAARHELQRVPSVSLQRSLFGGDV